MKSLKRAACVLRGHQWRNEHLVGNMPMNNALCYHRRVVYLHQCKRCGKTEFYVV